MESEGDIVVRDGGGKTLVSDSVLVADDWRPVECGIGDEVGKETCREGSVSVLGWSSEIIYVLKARERERIHARARSDNEEGRTKGIDEGEINDGARGRLATVIEKGLWIEGGGPADGIDPSEEGGKELEEVHGGEGRERMCRWASARARARVLAMVMMMRRHRRAIR